MPADSASLEAARSNAVFPIPAGPWTTSSRPDPFSAERTAAAMAASSASRSWSAAAVMSAHTPA